MEPNVERLESVVIRFVGDSGDGMQLTGTQFTNTSALVGNDLATLPDYPAEIRAPAGTRAGVSGFQIHLSSHDIYTPGDQPDVLVAMNPAALITNIGDLRPGGIVIVNVDRFRPQDLAKAELESNPLEDGTLDNHRVIEVPLTRLTREAVAGLGLNAKESDRCKNFFALGLTYWMFHRPVEHTRAWIKARFQEPFREANLRALQAGLHYAETIELFQDVYDVLPARLPPGTYRNVTGNQALALGLLTAGRKAGLSVFYASYPITPASDLLHALANYKHAGVHTFQAEDEIAACCAAIGASYAGAIGVTATSGPGLALKQEAIGLAVMAELPLVVIDVQRGGPSTGLPTKTEQADLLMSMWGRNGESPVVVLAAATPADCFDTAIEAVRIALEHMVPVLVLSDGYLANGAEPWRIPATDSIPAIGNRRATSPNDPEKGFLPYLRDPDTLARPWALPGTPGLEHRIGGLEKEDRTGNVSYDPENHERMCRLRQEKVERVARRLPAPRVDGPEEGLLVLTWGSTFGAARQAVREVRATGRKVAHLHLRHLNPFPPGLGEVLARYDRVLVPEMNLGQLVRLVRDRFLVDARPVTKIQGKPFKVREIRTAIESHLEPREA